MREREREKKLCGRIFIAYNAHKLDSTVVVEATTTTTLVAKVVVAGGRKRFGKFS